LNVPAKLVDTRLNHGVSVSRELRLGRMIGCELIKNSAATQIPLLEALSASL
jgi:hypothetical protein